MTPAMGFSNVSFLDGQFADAIEAASGPNMRAAPERLAQIAEELGRRTCHHPLLSGAFGSSSGFRSVLAWSALSIEHSTRREQPLTSDSRWIARPGDRIDRLIAQRTAEALLGQQAEDRRPIDDSFARR
jgi:hypothetical protein